MLLCLSNEPLISCNYYVCIKITINNLFIYKIFIIKKYFNQSKIKILKK